MSDLNPGRELDALVAERVMGWRRMTYKEAHPPPARYQDDHRLTMYWHDPATRNEMALAEDSLDYYTPQDAWSPSTSIKEAWEVVEKVWGSEWFRLEKTTNWQTGAIEWNAGKITCFADELAIAEDVCGITAPHAIALAALKAVGVG